MDLGLATLKLRVATSGSPKKLTPAPNCDKANINSEAAGVSSCASSTSSAFIPETESGNCLAVDKALAACLSSEAESNFLDSAEFCSRRYCSKQTLAACHCAIF